MFNRSKELDLSLLIALQPSFGPSLVVGGGTVAARKVSALLEAGFAVTVVAPEIEEGIASTDAQLHRRGFIATDLDGIALVFACTNNRALNHEIGALCRAAGVPVLVADSQSESTFFSVATLRRGDVQVGVSTSGAGPGLAAAIRDSIAANLSADLAEKAKHARKERSGGS